MSPDLTKYWDVVKNEISRVDNCLRDTESSRGKSTIQRPDYDQFVERSKDYLAILKKVEPLYASNDQLIGEAYDHLNGYIDTYLGLLSPGNAAKFNQNDPKIILFADPEPSFRRFPLAKKFLLAIRKSDMSQTTPVWASLAHELGHFVYWNSKFSIAGESGTTEPQIAKLDNTLFLKEIWTSFGVSPEELKSIPSGSKSLDSRQQTVVLAALMTAWSEEIFADIVGVYLSEKEEYFTQSRELYFSGLTADQDPLLKMDVDHPDPILRPYIAAKALENKTRTPNDLWRSFKLEVTSKHKKQILAKINEKQAIMIKDQQDIALSDDSLALTINLNDELSFEIDFETLKPAILKTIELLAPFIGSSIPYERPGSIEFIEEFADLQRLKDIGEGTIRALAAIFRSAKLKANKKIKQPK